MVASGADKVEGIGAIVDEEQALAVSQGRHAEAITGSRPAPAWSCPTALAHPGLHRPSRGCRACGGRERDSHDSQQRPGAPHGAPGWWPVADLATHCFDLHTVSYRCQWIPVQRASPGGPPAHARFIRGKSPGATLGEGYPEDVKRALRSTGRR